MKYDTSNLSPKKLEAMEVIIANLDEDGRITREAVIEALQNAGISQDKTQAVLKINYLLKEECLRRISRIGPAEYKVGPKVPRLEEDGSTAAEEVQEEAQEVQAEEVQTECLEADEPEEVPVNGSSVIDLEPQLTKTFYEITCDETSLKLFSLGLKILVERAVDLSEDFDTQMLRQQKRH